VNFIKKYWLRWNIQRHRGGDSRALDRLYALEDPWSLNTSVENVRFTETVRIIRDRIGKHFGSILEIGCGEGLQTKCLAALADRIVGIDPSTQAIKRASDRGIKNAVFEKGELINYQKPKEDRFDLVTACEVIYYLKNTEQAYQILSAMGKVCLVTYYEGAAEPLDSFFGTKGVESETIRGPSQTWRIVWWRPEQRPASCSGSGSSIEGHAAALGSLILGCLL
jgi:SAM-dependent methyltransferase